MDNDASKDWEGPWPDRASAKPRDCPECPALCEQCSKVPFRGSELSVFSKPGRHSDTWYLGTFGDLRSRNCPFCQLVESVCWGVGHSWERLSKPDDSREVHVKWWEQYCGFGVTDLAPLGSFICFSDADEARLVRTKGALEGWINTDICKRWLSECEKRHRPECSPIPFNTEQLRQSDGKPLVMRLVDVEAMCIIDAPRSCRYLALSYVWGNPMDGRLVLNLNNRHALTKPHALRAHWDIIPKTISSAMKFVKDLGERYLWVDSLCLVQNDEKEVAECTRVMDKYYAMATLTIVPASGTDAYTGLPGVHPTPRKSTRLVREVLPGIRMTTMEDLDKVLRVSYYSRRGWT